MCILRNYEVIGGTAGDHRTVLLPVGEGITRIGGSCQGTG